MPACRRACTRTSILRSHLRGAPAAASAAAPSSRELLAARPVSLARYPASKAQRRMGLGEVDSGSDMGGEETRLDEYARLAVRVGVNLQSGQLLLINGLVEHEPLVRAAAREA